MMTVAETADWLRGRDRFLIIMHRRPDGDAIGCAGALARGLRSIGKTAYILFNDEATPRYLPFVKEYWAYPGEFEPEHIITVDTASIEVFPDGAKKYSGAVSLCIDHHPSNTLYAEANCIDGTRAACGEIIYEILLAMSGSVDPVCAGSLYVALATDTGCFAFANTTANTLRTAALLIEDGAPHTELNRMLFRTKTRARVKIEGMITSNLEFCFGGRAAIATITRALIRDTGATEDDLDDIASIPGAVEGVLAGITVRELSSENDCKVSVRTSPSVSAHGICAEFGGGGHPMAAGFSEKWSAAEIKQAMTDVLGGFLPNENN